MNLIKFKSSIGKLCRVPFIAYSTASNIEDFPEAFSPKIKKELKRLFFSKLIVNGPLIPLKFLITRLSQNPRDLTNFHIFI